MILSYARAVSRGAEAHSENTLSTEVDLLEMLFVDVFNNNGIEFTSSDISTYLMLGNPRNGNKRMTVVGLTNRKTKDHILR